MKFSEMKYTRPDVVAIQMAYRDMAQRFPLCDSPEEQLALLDQHEAFLKDLRTMGNLAYIRNSIDTTDPFYREEQQFFDESLPVLQWKRPQGSCFSGTRKSPKRPSPRKSSP